MDNGNNIKENLFNADFSNPANPFGNNSNSLSSEKTITPTPRTNRLNGYDSTILNSSNFDETQDQELSIDFRIKEKESILKDLDEKIKFADNYGTQNESLGLKAKKQRITQELATLKQQAYGGMGSIISDNKTYHSTLKDKMPLVYKIHRFISKKILAKVSKKVRSIVAISDSLEQLSDINKNVDSLIDLNVPYGERVQNYEKLTEYLNKASLIHSKIAKSIGK